MPLVTASRPTRDTLLLIILDKEDSSDAMWAVAC